jgi:diguanylate cyclase (GGDEF)-like protein
VERSVPPPSRRLLVALAACTVPLAVLVALTEDAARHQAAITAMALIATVVAVHAAVVTRVPAQVALAAGVALWMTGSAMGTLLLALDAYTTYPSVAEWFWLASYPAFWVAVMLMIPRWGAGHWLDGIVACLGAAAAGAALLMPKLTTVGLPPLGAAVASAYAIGDLLLLGFTGAALLIARRATEPHWRRLAFGVLLVCGTDLLFAARMAAGLEIEFAAWVDAGWVIGLGSLALVRPPHARDEHAVARMPVLPVACSIAALAVLVVDHYHRLADGAVWLAVAALALGFARTVGAARETARRAEAERLAHTDDLTRVGNRRRLFRDLGDAFAHGTAARLALFDLNGFKALNDARGHAAGDALLAELGRRLSAAVDGAGSAYRLGGDEFCVLLTADADAALERARAALHGDGVTASTGSVLLTEAADPTQALRLADARMYADKTGPGSLPT